MPNQGNGIQTKGLSILEDQLQHEYASYKKAQTHAQSFTDMQFKNLATNLAQQHLERYNRLFDYLNCHV